MLTATAAAIERTLSYFSLFQYPLTANEIWQLLWPGNGTSCPLSTVVFELEENNDLRNLIIKDGPFFQLASSEPLRSIREQRYRIATTKMRRAKRLASALTWLPWVEGVAVCNSLGYQNTRAKSDIDFFIITKPGTIWLTRFVTVGALTAVRQRPHGEHTPNALCLSFFVTGNSLNLAPLALPGGDPHFAYWIAQMTPLFGRGAIWKQFWDANRWVQVLLPNSSGYGDYPHSFYRQGKRTKPAGSVTRWLDRLAELFQRRRFPAPIREGLARKDSNVVASKEVLKFHTNDRRAAYRSAWKEHTNTFINHHVA
ncbi:hypothetical protein COV04_02305 [Candidatus Uhrbacteria bacterium CG10_big_fil_rev_8_21_14_0_10_48_11]|uniref:Polymerase nucleotidyl transferase domain-containing protein n=1 Tax=Candidatus Uhrbacteria bacterium CG10_big_fil_rev_8_21_14_0_10_48_11 TaxID=1975037 RepID=A0A2M8LES9_9BACT|nr:MAG: hypothetical protein COV04_02305 [Candidatus Uhrbacteria bacterium CG10_big_fil_rev_8_21_14_0_10_48_11]